ncbi:MAG: tetratricopeptide repeat protein, partial [Planctomycetota bacterium]|nr:tetratricopeptide repeat protein [Planctomycetota bacterium]
MNKSRLLGSLLILASFAAAEGDAYLGEVQAGVRAFEAGTLDQAVTHFARARQMNAKDWRGHAWHSMTVLRQATGTRNRTRRLALAGEAKQLAAQLIKSAGLKFNDPLYNYLTGLADSLHGRTSQALTSLSRAYGASLPRYSPYREIGLRDLVSRAFAHATIDGAVGLLFRGEFERAEPMLQVAAKALPQNDGGWILLHRNFAVVDESLGRYEAAIDRLEKCLKMEPPPALREELQASIAVIYAKNKQLKEAAKALAAIPKESRHIDVIAARATVKKLAALRDPRGAAMEDALVFFRGEMKTYPEKELYRLVEDFAELVLARVERPQLEKERPLVDEAMTLL